MSIAPTAAEFRREKQLREQGFNPFVHVRTGQRVWARISQDGHSGQFTRRVHLAAQRGSGYLPVPGPWFHRWFLEAAS